MRTVEFTRAPRALDSVVAHDLGHAKESIAIAGKQIPQTCDCIIEIWQGCDDH